jgi:hypothetical protein
LSVCTSKNILLEKSMEDSNDIKTRLMTLLNVSHLRAMRKIPDAYAPPDLREPSAKRVKLNQRRTEVAEPLPKLNNEAADIVSEDAVENDAGAEAEDDAGNLIRPLKARFRLTPFRKTQWRTTRTMHSFDTLGHHRQCSLKKHGGRQTLDY